MTNPLVSVVVPVYRVEPYLERCLDSIVNQDYRPLELILVNDGSPDGCGPIMRRYEAEFPFVKTLWQENKGLGPARNAGISVATGTYVAFLDSDDWAEPTFVSTLVSLAEAEQADVAFCNFSFDAFGLRLTFPFMVHGKRLSGPQAAALSLDMLQLPAFAWNKLYRRELFEAHDIPFPTIYYEDVATTPRVLLKARTVVTSRSRRSLYHYCLRGDSITGNFGVKNVVSYVKAIEILRRFLKTEGLLDDWAGEFRGLLRTARMLLIAQIVFQKNTIRIAARPAVIGWLLRKLRQARNS